MRNPTWDRDELVLALDMYLKYEGNPPGKKSLEIKSLSETLRHIGTHSGKTVNSKFRNENGVYMKIMNFRRFDPRYANAGKSGLSRGGMGEELIWKEFSHDTQACHVAAREIKEAFGLK